MSSSGLDFYSPIILNRVGLESERLQSVRQLTGNVITLNFSEDIKIADDAGFVTLQNRTHGQTTQIALNSSAVTVDGSTLKIALPVSALTGRSLFSLQIDPLSITDLAGNSLESNSPVAGQSLSSQLNDRLEISFETLGVVKRIAPINWVGTDGDDLLSIDTRGVHSTNDQLFGGLGNDTLNGGRGRDTLSGGEGDDVYVISPGNLGTKIIEATDGGFDTVILNTSGFANRPRTDLENIERIRLGGFNNGYLIGTAGGEELVGNRGDNIIEGFGGDDILTGGGGDDVFQFSVTALAKSHGSDIITDISAGDYIRVSDRAVQILPADEYETVETGHVETTVDGNDIILDIGINSSIIAEQVITIRLVGAAVNDGVSRIAIDGGNLTILHDGGDRTRFYDTLDTDRLSGTDGDDAIYGLHGFDSLSGGDGNDLLSGGTGNDTLNGGAGDDELYGGMHNDRLLGGDGNDTLDGGGGEDYLAGGAGDDVYIVRSGQSSSPLVTDRVVELGNAGIDTILLEASGTYTLGANIENLVVTSTTNEFGEFLDLKVTGNSLSNAITGGDANDYIDGSAGSDTLDGGFGNDTLVGGNGNDVLTGGWGNDTFIVTANLSANNRTVITDFSAGDRIDTRLNLTGTVSHGDGINIGRGNIELVYNVETDQTELYIDQFEVFDRPRGQGTNPAERVIVLNGAFGVEQLEISGSYIGFATGSVGFDFA